MNKKDLRILFLGTTSFAVEHLKMLLEENFNVVGIVTNLDKAAGRGHKIQMPPVKEFALDKGIPIFQPEKLKDPTFLEEIKKLQVSLGIVIAFRMLPRELWSIPLLGTVNIHGSLLPRWRGAAPINHAIIAGDKETGVSLFQLTENLDEGQILGQKVLPIKEKDNFESLHNSLANKGVELLFESLEHLIEKGEFPLRYAQDSQTKEPYAHKLNKENTRINWSLPAIEIHNFIRGLSPYPSAWTSIFNKDKQELASCKIFETEVVEDNFDSNIPVGEIIPAPKGKLFIATGKNILSIKSLQVAGKKRMDIRSFLNGNKDFNLNYFQ